MPVSGAALDRIRGKRDLSPRQLEILQYVAIGKSNEEIGIILGITMLTVKNHMQSILARLGAINRSSAVWAAMQYGILKPPALQEARVRIIYKPEELKDLLPDETYVREMLVKGDFKFDSQSLEVWYKGISLELKLTEAKLLMYFLRSPGRAYNRQHILNVVWSELHIAEERVVDVYVRRVRQVLEKHGFGHEEVIQTVRGIGYRSIYGLDKIDGDTQKPAI